MKYYVDATAKAGGDGSEKKPFNTIQISYYFFKLLLKFVTLKSIVKVIFKNLFLIIAIAFGDKIAVIKITISVAIITSIKITKILIFIQIMKTIFVIKSISFKIVPTVIKTSY